MATAGSLLQGMQGKLGTMVLRNKVGGGTVAANMPRKTNSNTAAQQKVRSGFKLITQLGTQLADVIAIPREGAKSSRNLFTQINYPLVYTNDAGSGIILKDVQLTKSNIAFPGVNITDRTNNNVFVRLRSNVTSLADKVVYVLLKNNNGYLTKIDEAVVEEPGDNGFYDHEFATTGVDYSGDIIAYAYGVKLETEAARVKYANLNISTADEVAQIIINRTFSASEASVTKTVGTEINTDETDDGVPASFAYLVSVNQGGLQGTVAGTGAFTSGDSVTVRFTPALGNSFQAWIDASTNAVVSTANPYTFNMPAHDVQLNISGSYVSQL